MSAITTMSGHFLISLERYYACIKEVYISTSEFVKYAGVLLSFAVSYAIIQLYVSGFSPIESHLYCFMELLSGDMEKTLLAWLGFAYLAAIFAAMFFVYGSIYLKTYRVHAEVKKLMNRGLPLKKDENLSLSSSKVRNKPESTYHSQKVFFRCVLLLFCFLGCYILSSALIAYRLITKKPVPEILETIASTLAGFDLFLTPVLLLHLNGNYRRALIKVFWARSDS
jgi:hypothetical protein